MAGKWIEFKHRPQAQNDEGYISLNDHGEFWINAHLFEIFGRPEAVTLYFDPDSNRIGLQRTDRKRVNSIRVRPRQGAWVVRSQPFLRKWDIRLGGTYFFPEHQIKDDMLVLPLNSRLNTSLKQRR